MFTTFSATLIFDPLPVGSGLQSKTSISQNSLKNLSAKLGGQKCSSQGVLAISKLLP